MLNNVCDHVLGLTNQADLTKPASRASGLTIWVKPMVGRHDAPLLIAPKFVYMLTHPVQVWK